MATSAVTSSLVNNLGGTLGFGEQSLTRNDDSYTNGVNLASVFGISGLNFFGTSYSFASVNNNGNITLSNSASIGLSTYTPFGLANGGYAIIAPFFADADTRTGTAAAANQVTPTPGGNSRGSNLVWYDLDPTGNGIFTVTWDDVGYYNSATDKLNAFQLQIVGQGSGNFDIIFRYENVDWTTGTASGGTGGLGGTVARAGYSTGDGVSYYELPQSGNQNAILSLDTTTGNTGVTGYYQFNVRTGTDASETLTGTSGDDLIAGAGGNDVINGLAGNDYLIGNAGADTLIGGTGDDTYSIDATDTIIELPNEGIDTVSINVSYTLGNNLENLQLVGNTEINGTGNSADNTLTGNSGNNILNGMDGNDTVDYSLANSGISINLTLSSAQYASGLGYDTLISIENLIGSIYNDTLIGTSGPNILNGNTGNDILTGGMGNDTLNGGIGSDTATYSGISTQYIVTFDSTALTYTVSDTVLNRDGTDTLSSIEFLRFSNTTVAPSTLSQTLNTTYTLTPNVTSVSEGSNVTYTLRTTNVAVGTVFNFNLSGTGITSSDIIGGSLNGLVTVNASGSTTFSVGLAADMLVEGPETLVATVNTGINGTTLATAAGVIVNDNLITAPPTQSRLDDFVVLQLASPAIVGAAAGNDTYLISGSMIPAGQTFTISDPLGANSIQLTNGLSITSSQVTSTALKLNLSNGAAITVLNANSFTYDVGGNSTAGMDNVDVSYAVFVQNTLGVALPSSGVVNGGPKVIGAVSTLTTPLLNGSSAPVTATSGVDVYSFAPSAAKALVANTQIAISQFNTAQDKFQFDLVTALGATTLAALNGVEGITLQTDPFAGSTLINFGNNTSGIPVTLTLVGVTAPASVVVDVV